MTPFDYVTVLISIILGLGITQIVSGLADIIQHWSRVRLFWPHLLWILFTFFLHIQEWWVLYELRTINSWQLPVFLFTILYPINLFILARILFPSNLADSEIDFHHYYFSNARKFFSWALILALLSLIDNIVVHGYRITEQPLQILLILLLSVLIYKNYAHEWLHKLVAVLLTVLLLASLTWLDWTLGN